MRHLFWLLLLVCAAPDAAQQDPDQLFKQAKILHSADELDQAVRILQRLVSAAPGYADAWQELGLIAVKHDRFDEAGPYFERALAIQPADPFLQKWSGIVALYRGDLEGSLRLFRRMAEEQTDEVELADAYFFMGMVYSLHRDADQALELFQRSSSFRAYPSTRYRLAKVYHDLGRYDLAEKEYRAVLAEFPDKVAARNDLGWLYYVQGRTQDAVREWQEVLRRDPANRKAQNSLSKTYNTLGVNYWKQGQVGKAREMWNTARHYDRNNKATQWFLRNVR